MIIMPANNTGKKVKNLAIEYPGSLGILISPNGWRKPPEYMPYALDNGAFYGFDEKMFLKLLGKPQKIKREPLWVAVPDVVADAEATNKLWHKWSDRINFRLAFVAQDGHEPQDVPKKAYAVFVGGSKKWKIKNAYKFKGVCKWLHIGRVNRRRGLDWAEEIGADSTDSSGWFKSLRQELDLIEYITGKGQLKFNFRFPPPQPLTERV